MYRHAEIFKNRREVTAQLEVQDVAKCFLYKSSTSHDRVLKKFIRVSKYNLDDAWGASWLPVFLLNVQEIHWVQTNNTCKPGIYVTW